LRKIFDDRPLFKRPSHKYSAPCIAFSKSIKFLSRLFSIHHSPTAATISKPFFLVSQDKIHPEGFRVLITAAVLVPLLAVELESIDHKLLIVSTIRPVMKDRTPLRLTMISWLRNRNSRRFSWLRRRRRWWWWWRRRNGRSLRAGLAFGLGHLGRVNMKLLVLWRI